MNSSTSILLFITLTATTIVSAQYFGGHGLGILPGVGYHSGTSNLHFPSAPMSPYGNQGSRMGQGYYGNGGIGIKQTDANLADLYGLPRQLAQAPAPRPIPAQPLAYQQGPGIPYINGPQYDQFAGQYGQQGPILNGGHFGARSYLG